MIEAYLAHEKERAAQGIPALPLTPEQTSDLCKLLVKPPKGKENFLLDLITNRVSPGVDPAAKVKAEFLAELVTGKKKSPLIDPLAAIKLLGTMIGGYNVAPLVAALKDKNWPMPPPRRSPTSPWCMTPSTRWLPWPRPRTPLPPRCSSPGPTPSGSPTARAFPRPSRSRSTRWTARSTPTTSRRPADAWSRPDIPLHALAMGKTRFKDGLATIAKFRKEGYQVAFVGDVVGTGSSRKSACNSVLWAIGDDIPCVPNKKTAGVIIGGVIAPIFFNTAQDSGALPLKADVSGMKTGDVIVIDTKKGVITDEKGKMSSPS